MNFVEKDSFGYPAAMLLRSRFSGLKNNHHPYKGGCVSFRRVKVKMTINSISKMSLLIAAFGFTAIFLIGCQGEPRLSGNEQVKAFELAGPITPKVDIDQLLTAKDNYGTYTVGAGDVLELQMPTILTAVSPKLYKDLQYQQQQVQPYLCRVSDSGTITLPMLGQINIVGKTLAQIETEIVNAYYPQYIVTQPSVVCNVKEYYLKNVTVIGAVVQPGVYKLQSNEMSLVNALMKAGGIVEGGASIITIKNPKRKYTPSPQPAKGADEIKQLAELDTGVDEKYIKDAETPKNEADFSALAADLAFQPESPGATQGNLLVQRGSEILYTKRIDIKNAAQRAEYIKELQNVIGTEQAYIVGQAIEQLAEQFSPAIAASQGKQPGSEETELLEAANDLEHSKAESQDTEKKEDCPNCPAPASSAAASNQKYIETPVENKVKSEPVDNVNEVKFIEPVESKEQPAAVTPPANTTDAIVLPVKGLNIPFADVPLMEGDLIEVKRLNPAVFTVIGLAKSPGAFPYPPDVEYNLMQAVGFAGGIDLIADPRFVTVYRQDTKGEIVSAVFRIDRDFMAKSCNVKIKPGDIISIDVTSRTKRNVILNQMLRINFGVYVNPLAL
ncbi:MAG: polysaccharide biosynthesis/export family protein [Phycisphaerae bacterium]|nr:polysaccharide biosynthesis/export family protein [Phycisphaerae bacterium]